jgi:hypothetical protein
MSLLSRLALLLPGLLALAVPPLGVNGQSFPPDLEDLKSVQNLRASLFEDYNFADIAYLRFYAGGCSYGTFQQPETTRRRDVHRDENTRRQASAPVDPATDPISLPPNVNPEQSCGDSDRFVSYFQLLSTINSTSSSDNVTSTTIQITSYLVTRPYLYLPNATSVSFEFTSQHRGVFSVYPFSGYASYSNSGGYLSIHAPQGNVSVSEYTAFNLIASGFPGGSGGHGQSLGNVIPKLRSRVGEWPEPPCNPNVQFSRGYGLEAASSTKPPNPFGTYDGERMQQPLPYTFNVNLTVSPDLGIDYEFFCPSYIARRGAGRASQDAGQNGSGAFGSGFFGGEPGYNIRISDSEDWNILSPPFSTAVGSCTPQTTRRSRGGKSGGYRGPRVNGEIGSTEFINYDDIFMGSGGGGGAGGFASVYDQNKTGCTCPGSPAGYGGDPSTDDGWEAFILNFTRLQGVLTSPDGKAACYPGQGGGGGAAGGNVVCQA